MSATNVPNGPPTTISEKTILNTQALPKIVFAGETARILCVADIRGDYHELNRLIREHDATAVIHTGDFGFMVAESVDRMGDKILRHLIQYSPLLPQSARTQLLSIPQSAGRAALINQLNNSSVHFPLSQFPHLLSGAINFPVPVFTTWGLVEDVKVIEKFRTGEYEVRNLAILDEATSRLVEVGGVKLRLLGLGGTVANHKLFDYGEGHGSIAGAQGTMWTTALQIGELIDTAQRSFSSDEVRLFVSTAPISRNGLMTLVANALRADLTISCGLHFRYPVSYNEFSINPDFDSYRKKLLVAKESFNGLFDQVRDRVLSSLDDKQNVLLQKTLSAIENVPIADDGMWTNTWHWGLSDVGFGNMLLSINDSRISSEVKSNGSNFSHRIGRSSAPPSGAASTPAAAPNPSSKTLPIRPPTSPNAPIRPPMGPSGPASGPARVPARPGMAPGPNSGGPGGHGLGFRNAGSGGYTTRPPPGGSGIHAPRPHGRMLGSGPAGANGVSQSQAFLHAQNAAAATGKLAAGASLNEESKKESAGKEADEKKKEEAGGKAEEGGEKVAEGKAAPAATWQEKRKENVREKRKENMREKKDARSTEVVNDKKEGQPGKKDETLTSADKKEGSDEKPWGGEEATTPNEETKSSGDWGEKNPEEPKQKKLSLYIKGLPIPTTEEELKGLFGEAAKKAIGVKVIYDNIAKKTKDFGYIDFDNEESMNEALKAAGNAIRDTPVTVSIAKPPPRFGSVGRGRGGFRGRGRGGLVGPRRDREGPTATGGEEKP